MTRAPGPRDSARPNVLIVVLDDVGVEKVGAYGLGGDPPSLPALDTLASASVRFDVAWGEPSCSPARAALLSGRHPSSLRLGRWLQGDTASFALADDVVLLPRLLQPAGYHSAIVGKWHLVGMGAPGAATDPLRRGFDHHVGTLGNPRESLLPAIELGYARWERVQDGVPTLVGDYLTTVTTNDALDMAERLPEPWLLVVSYNAAHVPMHVPPAPLPGSDVRPGSSERTRFDGVIRALDAELGRLFDGLAPFLDDTWTFVLSDNGSAGRVAGPGVSSDRAKGSVYEGGVRVPFFVRPPGGTPARGCALPVSVVDVVPTVLDLIGPYAPQARVDGASFVEALRDPDACARSRDIYAEEFFPNGAPPWNHHQWAVRDRSFKLVGAHDGQSSALFDMRGAPFAEGNELFPESSWDPEAQAAVARFRALVAAQRLASGADRPRSAR